MTDTQMIDWLEEFVNDHGALLLHDGNQKTYGYSGLGLRPGFLNRSLREAIRDAACQDSPTRVISRSRRGASDGERI